MFFTHKDFMLLSGVSLSSNIMRYSQNFDIRSLSRANRVALCIGKYNNIAR